MNPALEITQLLNETWDFTRAIALLAQHTDKTALVKLLEKDPSSTFYQQMLRKALSEIVFEPEEEIVAPKATPKNPSKHLTGDQRPEALKPTIATRNDAVKERDFLKAKLINMPTKEERKEAAFRILALDDIIAESWLIIDYYEAHKDLPPTLEEDSVKRIFEGASEGKIAKILTNHRTYLTKEQGAKARPEKIAFHQAVLLECERRLTDG